jgi:hypothetical protein
MGRYLGHRYVTAIEDEDFEEIFDLDFTENEEYYRKDTLPLGYKNEAARIIAENKEENDGEIDVDDLIHRAFKDSYYLEYEYEIDRIGDITIISIAYLSQ